MARIPSFPTLYDEVAQIRASNLNRWGYLKPDQVSMGQLTWSSRGQQAGSASFKIDTSVSPYLELSYNYRGEPRKYKVRLTAVPSNLGVGKVWYFICPATGKRCRILYLVGGYFLHREAFTGCMYDSQTQSKYYRSLDKTFGPVFKIDKLYKELYSKYFKKTYAGKPTKRYLKIMEQIARYEKMPLEQMERQLLSGL